MIERFGKVFLVCLLGVILFTGCNERNNDNLDGDMNSGVTDNNNDDNVVDDNGSNSTDDNDEDDVIENKIDMVGLLGYLVADEEYMNRYYGFDNELGEKITKEFNINGVSYKFDVEMTSLSKTIEYKISLNNKLLDTTSYELEYVDQKNIDIDLFVLDGYAVVGYNNKCINVYNLSNYKLVDSFNIYNNMTVIVNKFELTSNSLSFVDVSNCPFGKVIIDVKNNDIKISKQTMDLDELYKYDISGAAC